MIDGDDNVARLTKREYFAAMAMQGLLVTLPKNYHTDSGILGCEATAAVMMADALIARLSKEVK